MSLLKTLFLSLGMTLSANEPTTLETATFANGCFWCTEAVFERLDGVVKVVSGYSGGNTPNPTYKTVSQGNTGHAEAIQLTFDPKRISYEELLEVFWQTHDPTTLNRQGADIGPQYRSAVFYHSEAQRASAEALKRKLDAAGTFRNPIVTEITPYRSFDEAESYHQDYYALNGEAPYCRAVIAPKIEKLEKKFASKLKSNKP